MNVNTILPFLFSSVNSILSPLSRYLIFSGPAFFHSSFQKPRARWLAAPSNSFFLEDVTRLALSATYVIHRAPRTDGNLPSASGVKTRFQSAPSFFRASPIRDLIFYDFIDDPTRSLRDLTLTSLCRIAIERLNSLLCNVSPVIN